jgi:hypothetical protein
MSWAERALLSGFGAGQPESGQKAAEPPAAEPRAACETPATEEKRSERVGEAGAGEVWGECGVWKDGEVGADQCREGVEGECVVKGLEEPDEEAGSGCGEEGGSAGEALQANRDEEEECEHSGGCSGEESSAEEENDDLLEVRVEWTDGKMSWFKIRQHTKLSKVFNLFCERFKVERDEATFLFDECEIDGFDTPHDLGLEVVPPAFLLGKFSLSRLVSLSLTCLTPTTALSPKGRGHDQDEDAARCRFRGAKEAQT